MKKTLSLVLALALALAMFSSFALIAAPADLPLSFQMTSLMVTDAAGYASPYNAVDNAALFVENQAAYVVVGFTQYGADPDVYEASAGTFEVAITSSTLDLGFMGASDKEQMYTKIGGAVALTAVTAIDLDHGIFFDFTAASGTAPNKIMVLAPPQPAKDNVAKIFYTFIAVTKPATAGMVQAAMKDMPTTFSTLSSLFDVNGIGVTYAFDEDATGLVVYVDGVAKYTIVNLEGGVATKLTYAVFSGASIKDANFLFNYIQNGTQFTGIGYPQTAITTAGAIPFTYNGKIVYTGLDGILGNADDKDLSDTVAAVNAFFGYSFQYNTAVKDTNFEAKTVGNPTILTDTYAMFTAVVTDGDGVDIAPTGDFSANIVIVMAASAVLAAAALAFVAKKARD